VRGGVLFDGDQPARVVSFISHLDGPNVTRHLGVRQPIQ
jgi:hypothetical protein